MVGLYYTKDIYDAERFQRIREIAAEMLASTMGLGYMIQQGRSLVRPDIILVGMVTIGVTGAILTTLLGKLENKVVRWRAR